MTEGDRAPGGVFAVVVAIVTIFAIAGTLSACGRYGSPVRVAPVADTTAEPIEEEARSADPSADSQAVAEAVDKAKDRSE